MERQLRTRLGAARLALEGKSGEVARVISNAQFRALREIVSRDVGLTTLTDEMRAEVLDMAVSCAWWGDDETNVLNLLEAPSTDHTDRKRRRPSQHFAPAILSYFTNEDWELRLGCEYDRDRPVVEHTVFSKIIALGGRNLDEHTSKFVNSFIMHLCDEHALQYTEYKKQSLFESMKKEFKRRCRFMPSPDPHIVMLPANPLDLQRSYRMLYQKVFPDQAPCICKTSLPTIMMLDGSHRCRGIAPCGLKWSQPNTQLQLMTSGQQDLGSILNVAVVPLMGKCEC